MLGHDQFFQPFVQDVVVNTYSEDLFDLVEEHIGELIDDPSVKAEVRTMLDEAPQRTQGPLPHPASGLEPEAGSDDGRRLHEVRFPDGDPRPRVR